MGEGKNMTHVILLVEDEVDNITITTKRLQRKGFEVHSAQNGREGVDKAVELKPNLILMDIKMPVMDGMEAIREIKGNGDVAAIPIIALTANALDHQRREILEAGADDFHAKPLDFKRLLGQIDKLLSTVA